MLEETIFSFQIHEEKKIKDAKRKNEEIKSNEIKTKIFVELHEPNNMITS